MHLACLDVRKRLLRDARGLRQTPLGHSLLFAPALRTCSPSITKYTIRFLLSSSRIFQTSGIFALVALARSWSKTRNRYI